MTSQVPRASPPQPVLQSLGREHAQQLFLLRFSRALYTCWRPLSFVLFRAPPARMGLRAERGGVPAGGSRPRLTTQTAALCADSEQG